MGWLKRNLFFAIGGVLALGLLGAAGFYDYASWSHNQSAFARLNEVYKTLEESARTKPSPGSGSVDNIAAANEQRKQIETWIHQAREYFQPIAPVPNPTNGPVSDMVFIGPLHGTIDQLQREAATANVQLPPQFDFSFTVQIPRNQFTGGVTQLAQQLGEVRAISKILFAARVNALDGIQRFRVSPDDASGPQTDYLDDPPVTNELAVLVPYQVTFRGFSPEVAQVLAGFAASPHGFIVKDINVQPAGAAAAMVPETAGSMPSYPPFSPAAPPLVAAPGRGGLQTVLNEQLLRVTLVVELVKLTPKN